MGAGSSRHPAAPSGRRSSLKRRLTSDQAKELAKRIREAFPKTKPVIQGDAVRVSAKSRDELQAVIADLRALDYPVALQFTNYR